jgi:four helix bundle protein
MEREKGLEGLQVWQRALAFAGFIAREVLPLLPEDEKWALTNQLRRSAQSIPANIAEGYGRYYYQEGVRFCYLARGSLEETFSHLALAKELDYISTEIFEHTLSDIKELRRMLSGYIAYLKRSKRGANEPGQNLEAHDLKVPYLSDLDMNFPDDQS